MINATPLVSRALRLLLAVLACMAIQSDMARPATAAEIIGKAEAIENRVTAEIEAQHRTLAVPEAVHRDETVRTEAKAQVRLRFTDETDLRLGPDAAIKLDAFVFSGKKDAAMELAKGTMRFVSGNGPKGSYQIRTPVATIGLRGTTVEVTIRQGRTYVALHEGAAQVCTRSGRCMALTNACTYLSVDARGVSLPQPLSNRTPSYSGQCSGNFCVQDACSAQLASSSVPPKAMPSRAKPPKSKLPRPRRRGSVQEEEIIIDEPEYRRPQGGIYLPGLPYHPGYLGPRGPRFPGGGRPPGTRPPGIRPPTGQMPGVIGPRGGNFRFR